MAGSVHFYSGLLSKKFSKYSADAIFIGQLVGMRTKTKYQCGCIQIVVVGGALLVGRGNFTSLTEELLTSPPARWR